jgi:Mor family transcriptional regulator
MQKVIEELSEIIGYGKAFEVAIRWAGRELSVPATITQDHPIALTIGFESAQKLCKAYGPGRITIPLERSILKDMRNRRIYEDAVVNGRSHYALAIDFGVSRPCITQIVKKMKEAADADHE